MASAWFKHRQKQLKARQSTVDKPSPGVPGPFQAEYQVRCQAGQPQGSWRVLFTWFLYVPVFGPTWTRYTCSWQISICFAVVIDSVDICVVISPVRTNTVPDIRISMIYRKHPWPYYRFFLYIYMKAPRRLQQGGLERQSRCRLLYISHAYRPCATCVRVCVYRLRLVTLTTVDRVLPSLCRSLR